MRYSYSLHIWRLFSQVELMPGPGPFKALPNEERLTRPLGTTLSELPLEPMLGRCLLASAELGCGEELLTLVAMLSVQSVWRGPGGRTREYDEARDR